LIYDHTEPAGVFDKSSPVYIQSIAKLLIADFETRFPSLKRDASLPSLVAALKFSSIHYSDASTPDAILDLLEDA
jgi:hypothetical protein